MNLYLVVFLYVDIDYRLIGMRKVVDHVDFHHCVAETFVGVIFSDNFFGTVHYVLGNLVALHELEGIFEVALLALLHSDIVDFGNAGLLPQIDRKPRLVAGHLVYGNSHFREEALTP